MKTETIIISRGDRRSPACTSIHPLINYAGIPYAIKYRGQNILHLQSLRDENLIIKCPANSRLLSPYEELEGIHA